MPDVFAHYYFADIFKKNLRNLDLDSYFIGSQGPDFFYYYGQLYFHQEKSKLNELGTLIHKKNIMEAFVYIYNTYTKSNCNQIKSYLLGYLSHYVLDVTCHPFIFYRSGFAKEKREFFFYNNLHKKYEMSIDAALIEYIDIKEFNFLDILNGIEFDSIIKFYQNFCLEVYHTNLSEREIELAFSDFLKTTNFFNKHDRLVSFLRLFFSRKLKNKIDSVRIVKNLDYDFLNILNQSWLDPVTLKASNANFMQLLDCATKQFLSIYNALLNEDLDLFLKIIDARTFETGHPESNKMKIHDSYKKFESAI